MKVLLDVIGDLEASPLSGLLGIVGVLVEEYEDRANPIPELQNPLPSKAELRAAAATKLYELGQVSQEVAAQIAGVRRSEFLTVLSRHKVSPFQESAEEALAAHHILRR